MDDRLKIEISRMSGSEKMAAQSQGMSLEEWAQHCLNQKQEQISNRREDDAS